MTALAIVLSLLGQSLDLGGRPLPLGTRCRLQQGFPRLPSQHLTGEQQFVLGLHDNLLNLTAADLLLDLHNIGRLSRVRDNQLSHRYEIMNICMRTCYRKHIICFKVQ